MTNINNERFDREDDERSVRSSMRRFSARWAPADRADAADFHGDLATLVQAIHRDANRETHALLVNALAAIPPRPIFMEQK